MRKNRLNRLLFILMAALLTMLSVSLTGCSILPTKQAEEEVSDDSDPSHKYTVYYQSASSTRLVGKSYTPVKEDFTGIVDELIEQFKKSSDDAVSLLPAGITLKGYTINVDSLTVDFDGAYLGLSNVSEILLRSGIVKTLVQMPGIYAVSVTVEGQPIKEANGSVIGPMNEDTFIDTHGDNINSYRTIPVDLYFSTIDGKKLMKETQEVFCSTNLITERVIVDQIIDGPESDSLTAVTSPNISVNSVTVSNDICVIDLEASFNEVYREDMLPETCLYAFVNSICESCDVKGVQFRIDGESDIRFLGEINLNQTFTADPHMLSEDLQQSSSESSD